MIVLSRAATLAAVTVTAVMAEQDDVSPVVAMPMREGDVARGANASTPSSDDELTRNPIDPASGGCGRTDLNASYQYGLINERMHRGRAINFTASSEYNLLAGMIPHHMAAVAMCDVYLNEVDTRADISANEGIESLCYNITYGPASRGKWQHDFSQVGETEQMLDVLREIGMMTQYERGCADLSDGRMTHGDGDHGDMFMGCGRLDLPDAKDYMAANVKIRGFMALEWIGDNDVDFLLGLISHHEGTMDMCDIYYRNWKCPNRHTVCWDAHPLDGISADRLSYWKTHEVLADMKHICTDHIMATQPKEVAWMKAELRRLSPKSLAQYEAMQNQTGVFPCSSV